VVDARDDSREDDHSKTSMKGTERELQCLPFEPRGRDLSDRSRLLERIVA
jgi:hypothetical protein